MTETMLELLDEGWTQETVDSVVLDPAAPWDGLSYHFFGDEDSLWVFYKTNEEWEQVCSWSAEPTAEEVWTEVDNHEPKKQRKQSATSEAETFFRLLKEGGMTLDQVERVFKLASSVHAGRLMFKKDRKALWKKV